MRSFVVAALLTGCGALVLKGGVTSNVSEHDCASDQQLQVSPLVDGRNCLGGWNAINPSFALVPGTDLVAVALRGLCMQKRGPQASWYSKMVIGTVPVSDIRGIIRTNFHWNSLDVAPDPRALTATRHECYMRELDTAKGPEDPRLVQTKEGLFAIVTGYDVVEGQGNGSTQCGKHGMLLYAARVETLSPPKFGPPVQLTFEGMGKVEKNWAMFTPPAANGADVLAVYSVSPHTIAKVSLHNGTVEFIAQSESVALDSLAKQLNATASSFHGGAGVAYTEDDSGEYFLSVLHTAVRRYDGATEYWNYPYKFSPKPPYQILSIGKKLPLQVKRNPAYGEYVAFVTAVMVDNGDVFIGYGSGDSSSRTFRMPHAEFEAKFFPRTSFMEEFDIVEDVDAEDFELLGGATEFNASIQCVSKIAQGCHDDLTPSVCRACHEHA